MTSGSPLTLRKCESNSFFNSDHYMSWTLWRYFVWINHRWKLINDKLIIMKMNRCILFLFPIKNHKNCFDQIEFLLFSIIIICGCFDTTLWSLHTSYFYTARKWTYLGDNVIVIISQRLIKLHSHVSVDTNSPYSNDKVVIQKRWLKMCQFIKLMINHYKFFIFKCRLPKL